MLVGTSAAVNAQMPQGAELDKAIRVQIEMERARSSVSDTARVRVWLINTSDQPVSYVPLAPPELVKLVITRDGKTVEPNVRPGETGGLQVLWTVLNPHQEFALNHGEPMPLTYFGYRLQVPGTYTLAAQPNARGKAEVAATATTPSNAVTFTITK
jgi:hypothetical protein